MQYMFYVSFYIFQLFFYIYHRKPKLIVNILLETLDFWYIIVESKLKCSYLIADATLTLRFVSIA
jgi:hypothetical protein